MRGRLSSGSIDDRYRFFETGASSGFRLGPWRRRPWLGAAFEGLDDDHTAAATGAWVGEYLRLVIVGGIAGVGLSQMRDDTEQFPHSHQVPGARCVGEQAVVTDAVEAVRQDRSKNRSEKPRSPIRATHPGVSPILQPK